MVSTSKAERKIDHRGRKCHGVLLGSHERRRTAFHVQNEAFEPLSDLLRDDGGGDQADLIHGRREVASRIQDAIGRCDVLGLTRDEAGIGAHLIQRQIRDEARNRFQFVDRPPPCERGPGLRASVP